jgi:hypothetical protein
MPQICGIMRIGWGRFPRLQNRVPNRKCAPKCNADMNGGSHRHIAVCLGLSAGNCSWRWPNGDGLLPHTVIWLRSGGTRAPVCGGAPAIGPGGCYAWISGLVWAAASGVQQNAARPGWSCSQRPGGRACSAGGGLATGKHPSSPPPPPGHSPSHGSCGWPYNRQGGAASGGAACQPGMAGHLVLTGLVQAARAIITFNTFAPPATMRRCGPMEIRWNIG